jgi:hypothetical protein
MPPKRALKSCFRLEDLKTKRNDKLTGCEMLMDYSSLIHRFGESPANGGGNEAEKFCGSSRKRSFALRLS